MNMPEFLDRFSPRDFTVAKEFLTSSALWVMESPVPPPPAVAFSMTGNPSFSLSLTASSSLAISSCVPGSTGTPAFCASSLAVCLKPKVSMLSGLGPTQAMPAAATSRAKSVFSDRKP